MQIITSKDNENIKSIKKLKERKYRDLNNEYIIEGIKILKEAIQEKAVIKKIVICEECLANNIIDEKLLYESDDTTVSDDPTFGVLEYAQCPAVLSEQCFLTNSADVDLLADEDGCQRAAQLYYEAICSWFNLEPNQ